MYITKNCVVDILGVGSKEPPIKSFDMADEDIKIFKNIKGFYFAPKDMRCKYVKIKDTLILHVRKIVVNGKTYDPYRFDALRKDDKVYIVYCEKAKKYTDKKKHSFMYYGNRFFHFLLSDEK